MERKMSESALLDHKYGKKCNAASKVFEDNLCFCCLSQATQLIKLVSCKHMAILSCIPNFRLSDHTKYICVRCHNMLAKFSKFRSQVQDNLMWLHSTQTRRKPLKNMFYFQQTKTRTISVGECARQNESDSVKEECVEYMESKNALRVKVETSSGSKMNNVKIEREDHDYDKEHLTTAHTTADVCGKAGEKKDIIIHVEKVEADSGGFEFANLAGSSTSETTSSSYLKKEPQHKGVNYEGKVRAVSLSQEELDEERLREKQDPEYLKMEFKCESCIMGFSFKEILDDHIRAKHTLKSGSAVCDICLVVVSNQYALKIHRLRHYKRFECERCPYRTKGAISLAIKHYNDKHERVVDAKEKFACSHCDFVANSYRNYRCHVSSKHERRSALQCEVCLKTYARDDSLQIHRLTQHGKDPIKKLSCKFCGKQFSFKNKLRAHQRTVHGAHEAAHCALCDRDFKCELTLRAHLRWSKRHALDTDKKYVCDYCGERFSQKPYLSSHIQVKHFPHTLPRCPQCSKTLSSAHSLKKHIDFVHNKKRGPRNNMCHYCGRGFTSARFLRVHIRTHTGERPLSCSACAATFAHPASLYNHTKLKHTQGKTKAKRNAAGDWEAN